MKKVSSLFVSIGLWLGVPALGAPVDFYFSAHPDDWALFMNPAAWNSVQATDLKTVFVYTTAGDAGAGTKGDPGLEAYYLARENGARFATQFLVNGASEPSMPIEDVATVNGHKVFRVTSRNTVSYFLRLPDGNPGGTGYASTGQQSLRRLRTGQIPSISAVDNSATYQGSADLTATLQVLLATERAGSQDVRIHVADTNATLNPGDHSDHLSTASFALDAIAGMPCVARALYVDYASAELPENLSSLEMQVESGTFAALATGLNQLGYYGTWDDEHRSWLGRSYSRAVPATGVCF